MTGSRHDDAYDASGISAMLHQLGLNRALSQTKGAPQRQQTAAGGKTQAAPKRKSKAPQPVARPGRAVRNR
jgi:hypothetical protein